MDTYQQHHQRFMRPPQPPSTADPHLYPHHLQPRPPLPPQNTSWYPPYPYPPPQSSHSPSPPPPQQWAPPHSSYPPPPPPPSQHAYPPQNHHFAPPPPQSYSQNWGQPQAWDYQVHNNAEDWAARARAWAAAKQMEDQYQQSQFTPVGRPEEQTQFQHQEQYPPVTNAHYQDIQQQPYHALGYQQFSASAAIPNQPPALYPQDSFNSSQPSRASDGRVYAMDGGMPAGGAPSTSPSVHQQEVPSSYSSVTGKGEISEQKEHPYSSLPLAGSSAQGQHHVQSSVAAGGGSFLMEQSYAHGNQAADPTVDLSDQPLNFAPSFMQSHNGNVQSNYAAFHDSAGATRGVSPVTPVPSMTSWPPAVATGNVYPPIPSVPPSGPQHDPSVSGAPLPPFGGFPGPSFQPPIPSTAAPYAPAFHATSGFSGDVYGVPNISERPKKASVPNWLKEEIFKNASAITRSSLEHPKEETLSIEDEGVDKSFVKADQADSKSVDSSRSIEEEDDDDDDEDNAEAARTAAMNQEIKRILTEVLLKVTDELFDEIATKVLDEDNQAAEVGDSGITSKDKLPSPLHSTHSVAKASAKVLVPVKAKDSKDDESSSKSSSSSPGNVLGLANYASDEDEGDEIQSSGLLNSGKNVVQQSPVPKFSEDVHNITQNGSSEVECPEKSIAHSNGTANLDSSVSKNKINSASNEAKNSSEVLSGAQELLNSFDSGKTLGSNHDSGMKDTEVKNLSAKPEPLDENFRMKKSPKDDSRFRETRIRSDKDNVHERKRISGRDVKDAENRSRAEERGDDNHRRHEEKHRRKEKKDDQYGIKEKTKDHGDKNVEKVKESEARQKSSHLDVKEDRKEAEKHRRAGSKEDDHKKREHAWEKGEDGVRHKPSSDSGRHKKRRSSSIGSRGRHSKDDESSDEVSYDSKRKTQSRKRHLSPSPERSRRRNVSRSPHSKHSQRRHSPYSSLETTRRKRSRSRSPSRRRR